MGQHESSEAVWRKSTRSSEQGDACVELAATPGAIANRDSQDCDGPTIFVSRGDFRRFAQALRDL